MLPKIFVSISLKKSKNALSTYTMGGLSTATSGIMTDLKQKLKNAKLKKQNLTAATAPLLAQINKVIC
ncbi:hypothetical protein O9G_000824 [Rozella allomycis CSF55]|uniref:Uncharacterized protein n=1 Tax=Rozella allomycis (strain CSF55) TaxID=988480 RepID=A0A075AW43_ROZAC|nr:hypothetical protein O9G_000824 [Rozella allomycis CSF55]|eukprot:EPZ32749.1 hypothetical protein O9G_000824 [Rozella allomycis CSF55]